MKSKKIKIIGEFDIEAFEENDFIDKNTYKYIYRNAHEVCGRSLGLQIFLLDKFTNNYTVEFLKLKSREEDYKNGNYNIKVLFEDISLSKDALYFYSICNESLEIKKVFPISPYREVRDNGFVVNGVGTPKNEYQNTSFFFDNISESGPIILILILKRFFITT